MSNQPRRIDSNQPEIVKALRQAGALVNHTHTIGHGFPDVIVGYKGRLHLLEIKDGSLAPSKRRLTPDEMRWHSEWTGYVSIVNDPIEALKVIGVI